MPGSQQGYFPPKKIQFQIEVELNRVNEWVIEVKIAHSTLSNACSLSNLLITRFPKTVLTLNPSYWDGIKRLFVNGNQLRQLPEDLNCLTSLEQLYCENNYLRSLPETLSSLENLTLLAAHENLLTTIPESLKLKFGEAWAEKQLSQREMPGSTKGFRTPTGIIH